MTPLSDVELALFWLDQLTLPPGEYHAPAATLKVSPCHRSLNATGYPLAEPAARLAPDLAALLPPCADTLRPGDLLADYTPAHALQASGIAIVPHELFAARLLACRACSCWRETERDGQGRCDHPAAPCDRRLHFLPPPVCPASKWPA